MNFIVSKEKGKVHNPILKMQRKKYETKSKAWGRDPRYGGWLYNGKVLAPYASIVLYRILFCTCLFCQYLLFLAMCLVMLLVISCDGKILTRIKKHLRLGGGIVLLAYEESVLNKLTWDPSLSGGFLGDNNCLASPLRRHYCFQRTCEAELAVEPLSHLIVF